ncbi:MAG: nicotinate phosphoribosyltransferase [Pseudomonadota bacterium]|nr:nicotinate phosphoribosyltransferase [Pseudomonadota bacterium]
MSEFDSTGPSPEDQPGLTDTYFRNTRRIVQENGDCEVEYAVFMRRPVTYAGRLAIGWLKEMAAHRGVEVAVEEPHVDGAWVGSGEVLCYIRGPFATLVDLETIFLQRLGGSCLAAYNAYNMCVELPGVAFLAMDARHCAGSEMAELMAYGASVGSKKAKAKAGAIGFIGSSTDATAHFFGQERGVGTMPHALVGYAGSTLRAAQMFHESVPDAPLTVLVDYFGREITDSLAVANHFPELAAQGRLAFRLDTHGGRFSEGLDTPQSYAVLDRHVPYATRGYRTDSELKHLMGTGVSVASVWHLRETLDANGFDKVRIVASSGFGPDKCRMFSFAKAPVDVIGTGSFLPQIWSETYATADIISYDGKPCVKSGREFLLRK